jgi:hypothetical protein
MSIGFSVPGASAITQALRDAIDAAGTAGYCEIYGGTRPINGGAPDVGSLIAVADFADPSGSIDSNGVFIVSQGPNGTVSQSGTPTWARVFSGNDTRVCDLSARLAGTAADPDDPEELVIDAPALSAGAFIRILAGSISV